MNALRLALAFGRPDVDAFLREMDSAQFSEWVAFLTYFPTPLDIATASIRETIVNTMTTGRAARARDFLPDRLRRPEEEAPAGHFTRMFKIIAKRFKGGSDAGD